MKIITAILLSVALFSCGLSKSEKRKIELMITLHNMKVHNKFVTDSLKEDVRIQIENIRLKGMKELEDYRITNGRSFKRKWNEPYDITKDFELTMNKYLDYCKANTKDPETFYKFMD